MRLYIVIVISLLFSACAVPRNELFEAFHNAKPRSILVVPPINNSTDVEASDTVLFSIPYYIAEKGYYTFPANTVRTILEHEGYYEPVEVHSVPTESLANLFKADAVLYLTIHKWTAEYFVVATRTVIDIEYQLKSADGTELWSERQHFSYSPNSNIGGGIGLIANTIASAVERAKPNFRPTLHALNTLKIQGYWRWNAKYQDPLGGFMSGDMEKDGIPPGPYRSSYAPYYKTLGKESSELK